MRKIINRAEDAVLEMCSGIALAHPELEFLPKYKIIKKRKIDQGKVSLISGGGSGHEPAHAGFVGKGMLDAAVCGDVFASPSQIQVYQAIRETKSDKGTLLIIKNYSGDMMNFKNAAYLAEEDGIHVDYVKVDDDIAVKDSLYTVGRRGVAGTVLVHKIAGAAAEEGMSLEGVKEVAQQAAANVKSIGFAFSSCTVPAKGTPTFEIGENEMEYGVGIHGEPGIRREPMIGADELARRMVSELTEQLQAQKDDDVALLVNGFGSTPLMELYILNNAVFRELSDRGINVYRVFVGNYMTSIDMLGASVTLMKLDEIRKRLLDRPSSAPAFQISGSQETIPYVDFKKEVGGSSEKENYEAVKEEFAHIKNEKLSLENIIYIVDKMSDCIIRNEVPFCELDSHAGDGDFGMSVAKGFRQLRCEWNGIMEHHRNNIGDFLGACSMVIMEHCGGASGPIWGSAFRAAGKKAGERNELTVSEFAEVMQAAVIGVQRTGERSFGRGAEVGDKTLVDALVPCAEAWKESVNDKETMKNASQRGAQAAVKGAKATEQIVARMGRAGTVGKRSIGYPDAGAYALGVIFTEIADALRN